MKNKLLKAVMILFAITLSFSSVCLAVPPPNVHVQEAKFDDGVYGSSNASSSNASKGGNFSIGPITPTAIDVDVGGILGTIQWIGFIVGIAMCIWIGIKYLTAGASKKAEVKETMIPWLVGAALVALAPTLAATIFTAFQGMQ